jgi:hypothetical protein
MRVPVRVSVCIYVYWMTQSVQVLSSFSREAPHHLHTISTRKCALIVVEEETCLVIRHA